MTSYGRLLGILLLLLVAGAERAAAQQCGASPPCGAGRLCRDGQCVPVEEAVAAPGGRVYWVAQQDPAASDAGDGTADRPWKTIGRATGRNVLRPGDAVVVRAGTYREPVRPEEGGTGPEGRITLAAFPGEAVVVSGAVPLTGGWTRDGSAWRQAWTHTFTRYDGFGRELVVADGIVLEAVEDRRDLVPGTFFVEEAAGGPAALVVRLPDDADPNGAAMEAGMEPSLFWPRADPYTQCGDADQPGWLRVVGFTFRHATNWAQHGAVCVGGEGVVFEENTVAWTNGLGIQVAGRDHVLRANRALSNGQMGFGACCDGCVFEDNTSAYNNWRGYDPFWEAGGGKWTHSRNTVIRRHLALDNGGPGIWLDIDNEGLVVEDSRAILNEVAGIVLELDTRRTVVRNNVVFGTRFVGWSGTGLLSQAAGHNVIAHNTFVANEGTGLWIRLDPDRRAPDGHNVVYDNLFVANGTAAGVEAREIQIEGEDLAHARTNRLDGNLYWPHESDWQRSTFFISPADDGTGSYRGADLDRWRRLTQGDGQGGLLDPAGPLLLDAASPDGWRLAEASQARGRAVPLPSDVAPVAVDFDGELRAARADVGADEYEGLRPDASEPPTDAAEPPAGASGAVFEPGFPNPFQTSTTLAFVLEAPGPVRMRVVDVLGREVARLVDGVLPEGRHTVRYDAGTLPEGIYFCEFVAGTQRLVRTLARLR